MFKQRRTSYRSKRLQKKLHVDEFQELGFNLDMKFHSNLKLEQIESFVDRFLDELIEPNGMGYAGWESGYVASYGRGRLSEGHRDLVTLWLSVAPEVASYTVHQLSDSWYPEQVQWSSETPDVANQYISSTEN